MGAFEDREEGFEKRFAMGEELRFNVLARRGKLLGQWAAEEIGLSGEDVSALEKAVVEIQVEQGDDDAVATAIGTAFASANVGISQHRIRRKIEEFSAVALKQIEAGL
jgi:hypothetical protein